MATKRRAIDRWAPWMFLGVLLLTWELSVRIFNIDQFVLPSATASGPLAVFQLELVADHVPAPAGLLSNTTEATPEPPASGPRRTPGLNRRRAAPA